VLFNKKDNKSTGNAGQDTAAACLKTIGYKILERNLRLVCGGIDMSNSKNHYVRNRAPVDFNSGSFLRTYVDLTQS